jgi:hypothetical protein
MSTVTANNDLVLGEDGSLLNKEWALGSIFRVTWKPTSSIQANLF